MIWSKLRRRLAAWLMREVVFAEDTFGVSAEIFRPSGRGSYHTAGQLELPADLLNAIFETAYRTTPDMPGDISCVRLEIVAPSRAVLSAPVVTLSASASVQAQAKPGRDEGVVRLAPKGSEVAKQAERPDAAQPTLFDPGDADPGEEDDCDEHDFHAGLCWKCGALEEADDDEDIDPYEFLSAQLLDAGQGPKKADKRLDLAVEIYDHMVHAGIDGDDLEGVWDQWELFYAPLYERVVGASCDPQNAADRLKLIEQILDLAERKGIPVDSTPKVWEYFAMNYKASWTVTNGKRKLVISPTPKKVKAGR